MLDSDDVFERVTNRLTQYIKLVPLNELESDTFYKGYKIKTLQSCCAFFLMCRRNPDKDGKDRGLIFENLMNSMRSTLNRCTSNICNLIKYYVASITGHSTEAFHLCDAWRVRQEAQTSEASKVLSTFHSTITGCLFGQDGSQYDGLTVVSSTENTLVREHVPAMGLTFRKIKGKETTVRWSDGRGPFKDLYEKVLGLTVLIDEDIEQLRKCVRLWSNPQRIEPPVQSANYSGSNILPRFKKHAVLLDQNLDGTYSFSFQNELCASTLPEDRLVACCPQIVSISESCTKCWELVQALLLELVSVTLILICYN